MVDIIVAGHICLDLLPGMDGVPLAALSNTGMLYEVDALDISTGGAVANAGVALHILGTDAGLMGKVGDDLIGRVIIATLKDRDEQLASLVKVQPGSASSYTIALSPENADRIFLHCPGTNDTFGIDDIDFERVEDAKIFYLGYPPLLPRMHADGGDELAEIFRRVKAGGTVTALDTAQPDPHKASGQADWRSILEKTLPHVDIFVPSLEEIMFMLRRDDFDRWGGDVLDKIDADYLRILADELLSMGVAVTGFKLSRYGFYLRVTSSAQKWRRMTLLDLPVDAWIGAEAYHPVFVTDVVG
ncbi:MAG: PfkB family carbohydrate kinase, partial [Chloroflexota bacterium]